MSNYVVKIKFKNETFPWYSSNAFRESVDKLRSDEYGDFGLKRLFIPLANAKEVFMDYILRVDRFEKEIEYVAVIEMSTYEPFSEFRVLEFKEFK